MLLSGLDVGCFVVWVVCRVPAGYVRERIAVSFASSLLLFLADS